MFHSKGLQKVVILELTRRSHVNYIRPTAITKLSKNFRTSHQEVKTISVQTNYQSAPVFAAGRVIVPRLLDCVLLQLAKNPSLVEVFKLLCGVRLKTHIMTEQLLGFSTSFLYQIDVPEIFVGCTFESIFKCLILELGILCLGLYRAKNVDKLGNQLPFVFTNPLPNTILKKNDTIYVLAHDL